LAQGYVHRDVKPANLLLDASCATARLADLGLAAGLAELAEAAQNVPGVKPSGGFHKQRMVRKQGHRCVLGTSEVSLRLGFVRGRCGLAGRPQMAPHLRAARPPLHRAVAAKRHGAVIAPDE
jgi:serine/threonine protein kinase